MNSVINSAYYLQRDFASVHFQFYGNSMDVSSKAMVQHERRAGVLPDLVIHIRHCNQRVTVWKNLFAPLEPFAFGLVEELKLVSIVIVLDAVDVWLTVGDAIDVDVADVVSHSELPTAHNLNSMPSLPCFARDCNPR